MRKNFLYKLCLISDYLIDKRKDADFEYLPDTLLAALLRQFFAEVRKKDKKPYSKSGMINLRAGLNRYLQSPPFNRIINLMRNDCFQNANSVFTGVLRTNKDAGLDTGTPKTSILPADLDKLYTDYFMPGLETGDTEILQHKIFVDLIYFMGRRAKEGLRQLKKEYFQLKYTPEGREYIEIVVNETTKKNQGDNMSTRSLQVHNNPNVMFAQPGSDRCPVNSFKHYAALLSDKIPELFQRPNVKKKRYDAVPVGVNTLQDMMDVISKRANLSRVYTNHQIRKTTATGMKKEGANTKRIADQLKQKNLQALQNYLDTPTLEEKQENADMLFNYSHNRTPLNKQPPPKEANVLQVAAPEPPANKPETAQPNKENFQPENAIIPFEPNLNDDDNSYEVLAPVAVNAPATSNQVVNNNQLKQAANIFAGATFNNCQITLNIPK